MATSSSSSLPIVKGFAHSDVDDAVKGYEVSIQKYCGLTEHNLVYLSICFIS